MREKIVEILLIALLVSISGLLLNQNITSAKETVKWEYKIAGDDYRSDEQAMNKLGSDGWELVAIDRAETGPKFYFKRQAK